MKNTDALNRIKSKFNEIQDSELKQIEKDMLSAGLMTDMERIFGVPILNDDYCKAYKKKHPEIMQLYTELSDSRLTLWE